MYSGLESHLKFDHFEKQHLVVQLLMKYHYMKRRAVENGIQIPRSVSASIPSMMQEMWYLRPEQQKIQKRTPCLIPYQNKHLLPY